MDKGKQNKLRSATTGPAKYVLMPTGMLLPATAITAIASVLIARRCHRQKVNANADATAKKEKVHELCVLVEICCDTVQSVTAAVLNGADRVELCANLVDGGTTPSPGLIRSAVRIAKKCSSHSSECRVNVLIRPRGGDFVYTAEELSVMEEDIRFCKRAGCNGVVLGVLDRQGGVDVQVTRALVVGVTLCCRCINRFSFALATMHVVCMYCVLHYRDVWCCCCPFLQQ